MLSPSDKPYLTETDLEIPKRSLLQRITTSCPFNLLLLQLGIVLVFDPGLTNTIEYYSALTRTPSARMLQDVSQLSLTATKSFMCGFDLIKTQTNFCK